MIVSQSAGSQHLGRHPQVGLLRLRAPLLAAVASVALGGCGVYLHDARLATSTSTLKTDFEKLEAPALFAELDTRQASFSAREDKAVADGGIAARDAALQVFIRTPSASSKTGMAMLDKEVQDELGALYGNTDSPENLKALLNEPEHLAQRLRERGHLIARVEASAAGFAARQALDNQGVAEAAQDKRRNDCKSVLANPPRSRVLAQLTVLEKRYVALAENCEGLSRVEGPRDVLSTVLATAPEESQLGAVRRSLSEARQARKAAETETTALKKALKDLETKADGGATLASLNDNIAAVRARLEDAQPYAKRAGLERISELIENALAAELDPEEGTIAAPDTVKAAAFLKLARALAQADDAFASRPRIARTNELLLGAARLRHDLRMVQVDIAREEAETRNLEAQALALLVKAAHLARARYVIQASPSILKARDVASARSNPELRTAAGEALAAYAASWDGGEIPYRVLQFRLVQIKRASALERARLTEADYRTSLKPVFDQLAAYGDGGIKPETIAELLGNLGVAGAILER